MLRTLRRLDRYWHSLLGRRGGIPGDIAAPAPPTGLHPDEVNALVDQAQEHLARGEAEDARDCFELALAHAPDCVPALAGLAGMLREAGDVDAALEHVRRALQIAPHDAGLHFESALAHSRRGDAQAALEAYRLALASRPDYVAANINLGMIYLGELGDPRRAQKYFERAVASEADSVAAQANLGLALDEQGRVDEALAHYEKLIAVFPQVTEYRWNRGVALLSRGDYARGWEDYELRDARGVGAPPRAFPYPAWTGDALSAGALLVYAEQGIGDEIMFASCLPDLLARGLNCVIECNERLAALFERSFAAARVHGAARDGDRRWLARHPDIRAQIAIGSLPRLLRRAESDFPSHSGYLRADPERVARWRATLAADAAARRVVGISWRGGTPKTRQSLRTVPLPQLAPLFAGSQPAYVNLQRGDETELALMAADRRVKFLSYPDVLNDLDDTAALIQALDCVVTADNTVAHLAGALGQRVVILLPCHADWRWLRERSTSPWYPSATLHRQQQRGDWTGAIEKVATELRTLA